MDFYDQYKANILEALRNLGPCLDQDPACTFSLYEDVGNGVLAAAIDTYNNSLLHAKRRARRITRDLQSTRQLPNSAELLPTYPRSQERRMLCYNPTFAQMKHILCRDYYHQLVEEITQTGQVLERLLKILDELVNSNIFDTLIVSSPFRIGISSWESEEMWVVDILNWPPHTGPRV
jgi:hypothetical protein